MYTLGESGTQNNLSHTKKVLVSGNGTDFSDNPSLSNKAKRKLITQTMVLALIDVAKEKGDTKRVQAYWNTYHCQSKLISSEGKLYSKYCKNRFCTVCLAIRKADTINRYYPELKNWKDAHFVTLTVKAVNGKNLNKWVKGMNRAFELIKNRCKKRHQRGKGIKLIGVKSLECNFNPQKKTYNPHFHIIVPSKEVADLLKQEWIKQWKSDKKLFTSHKAQHIRKVEDLEHDLIETIKYGSKIFTEPDLKNKGKQALSPMVYAYALDNIFVAMKGIRIFERFGFNLPKQEPKQSSYKLIEDYKEWEFDLTNTDWINTNTGEFLTGFESTPELNYLLTDSINKEIN